jgi:hypothetical protein
LILITAMSPCGSTWIYFIVDIEKRQLYLSIKSYPGGSE